MIQIHGDAITLRSYFEMADVPFILRANTSGSERPAGVSVLISIEGGAVLPADMNDLKAAAYWFDQRHDGSDGTGNAGKVGTPCPRMARLVGVVASATHPARRSPTAALSAGQATASASSIQTADQ